MNPLYRFYFNTGGVGDFNDDFNNDFLRSGKRYANPLWPDSLGLSFIKESNEQFFRRSLDGTLTFVASDYDYIVAQAFDTKFLLTIEWSTDNGETWSDYWHGKFYKTDCKFDADAHTVQVTPTVNDAYGAVLDGLDKEYNLIELLPEIVKINYDKRPLVQIYSPGERVISCFLSGMWWEQECTPESNTAHLQNQYHFAQISSQTVYKLSGEVTRTVLAWGTDYTFNQDEESGSGGDYWLTELIRVSDGARWYDETAPGDPQPGFPITLQPDTNTPATNYVTVDQTTLGIYGRMLLDVPTILGQSTSPIPTDDIVPNNRNYTRVIGYDDSNSLIISTGMSTDPTQWGIYQPGQYYKQPYVIGLSGIYPVARSTWDNVSIWFAFSMFTSIYDADGRKAMTLNDAYPLYSVISVLLKQFAPDVTHGDGVDYSTFLYGTSYQTGGIKQGGWKPFITPKSNVLNSGYDMPAQKAPITLRSVLNMLRDCFRCFWWIDSDNKFRIEHIEYFRNGGQYSGSPVVGIDLTTMRNTRNGKNWAFAESQFTYEKPEMTQRYEFSWMDDVTDVFEGYPIEIVSGFVEQGKVEKINISQFTSDIDYMLTNPGACSQDGFALIGAISDGDNWVVPYVNANIFQWQNGYMAFRMLMEYYYYDLPAPSYKVNGSAATAYGVKRLKTQDVSFPSMDDPDTVKLIRTNIGDGNIAKLSITLSSRNVKATLNYEPE